MARPDVRRLGRVPARRRWPWSPRRRSRPAWPTRLALRRAARPGGRRAGLGKADLLNNDALPDISVDPDSFTVRIDGEVVDRPGRRAAHDPALLPVLMTTDELGTRALLLLLPTRGLPAGGHAPLGRFGGGRHGRRRSPTWPALARSAGPAAHRRRGSRPPCRRRGAVQPTLRGRAGRVPCRRRERWRADGGASGRRARGAHAVRAQRAASRTQGGGLLRLPARCCRARPGRRACSRRGPAPHHPLVLGAGGRRWRARRHDLPRGSRPPAGARARRSAAVRLLGLDPFAVQAAAWPGWRPASTQCAAAAAAPRRRARRPSVCPLDAAPPLDLLAELHIRAEVRLFAS